MTLDASWLANLYLIGGSPCSGKTTITNWIAEIYVLPTYRCDDAYFEHAKELTAEQPVFSRLIRANSDDIWMRPVPQQIDEELEIYREEFSFIVRDLKKLAQSGPVIAEGAALLPCLVATLGIASTRAIWIVPTEDFQRRHYGQRDWRHDVVKDCSDPEHAWENWMARDAGFARRVAREADDQGFALITVDGSASIETNIAIVERHFELRDSRQLARFHWVEPPGYEERSHSRAELDGKYARYMRIFLQGRVLCPPRFPATNLALSSREGTRPSPAPWRCLIRQRGTSFSVS